MPYTLIQRYPTGLTAPYCTIHPVGQERTAVRSTDATTQEAFTPSSIASNHKWLGDNAMTVDMDEEWEFVLEDSVDATALSMVDRWLVRFWDDSNAEVASRIIEPSGSNVTHSAGVLLGTPGAEDGLAICDGNGNVQSNLTRIANTPQSAPSGGIASQTSVNSLPSASTIAIATWDHATATDLVTDIGTLGTTLAGLNDISTSDVTTVVSTALATYDAPTKAELDAGLAALNDLSSGDVTSAVSSALATYDGPTKAEMDAGLAALNDLTSGEVQTAVTTALGIYDPPTKAELDSGLAALNDLTSGEVQTAVTTALGIYDGPTKAELDSGLAALNDLDATAVQAAAQAAITASTLVDEGYLDDALDGLSVGGGGGGGPVDQRYVSDSFTVSIPKRDNSTITQQTPLRVKNGEEIVAAIDFVNILALGDRLSTISSVTTDSEEDITLTALGVDRTLAKISISDATAGVTYTVIVTITTVAGDTLEGQFLVTCTT